MRPSGTNVSSATQPGMRKVMAGALAGAIVTVGVWVVDETTQIEIPEAVTAALGTIVTAVLVYRTQETYFTP